MDQFDESSGATGRGRRWFLRLAAASGIIAPFGTMAAMRTGSRSQFDSLLDHPPICHVAYRPDAVAPGSSPREVKILWGATGLCQLGLPVAQHLGLFAKRNLKVDLVGFTGAASELLEALATGKAEAGAGMAWQWLKPLEQGFDVKLVAAVHGGCIRLLTTPTSGIKSVSDLKGKTVGTFNVGSPDKIFISVLAAKRGIALDEIDWRVYPPDLLGVALRKGEIQAFSSLDPMASLLRDRDHLVEVSNNLVDEYAHRACCMLGISGRLVRDERPVAAAITAAVMEAQEYVAANPDGAAAVLAKINHIGSARQYAAMLHTETHNHHPVDGALTKEVTAFAEDLKQAKVLQSSTDPAAMAGHVCVDIFAT